MRDSIISIIERRHSCRRYYDKPLGPSHRMALEEFLGSRLEGPLGSRLRMVLLAATEEDRSSLKRLGTYGFIRGATAFMAGAVRSSKNDMEDYGYVMEHAVLLATDLGLGTCWLGGTFTKSSFARKISLTHEESMPAVVAVGYEAEEDLMRGRLRRTVRATERLPREQLFFEDSFLKPLREIQAPRAQVLEAVRWAPSASNKQPWRIVVTQEAFHLYLQRTKGYGKKSLLFKLLGLADLQRVDMGIAMCHLELAARELGFKGKWVMEMPQIPGSNDGVEYVVSWKTGSLPVEGLS